MDAGQYLLKVTTIPEANYNAASKVVNITVNKLSTAVKSAKVSVTYGSSKNLIVTLKDSNGNVLANRAVTVKLNNVLYTKNTNSKGQISVALPKTLAVKTYTASITFAGDSNHAKATGSQKVAVSKATPKIAASAKSFKVKTKTKKYTITLKTNLNKVMKSTKVTLKVKGKTYSAKTNSKGKATFKITKLTKKGKYAAVVNYKGSS